MKKLTSIGLSLMLVLMMCLASFTSVWAAEKPRLIDDADLFTAEEENYLSVLLDNFREKNDFDVVVMTTKESLEDPELTERADDYYDYEGYGCGENNDGCLLLIDMGSRVMHVSTTGYGITVLTDYGIDKMTDDIAAKLGDKDYVGAVSDAFMEDLEMMYKAAEEGEPYDVPDSSVDLDIKDPSTHVGIFLLALPFGLIIGGIKTFRKKRQLISVKKKKAASDFVKPGSLNLRRENDYFLYSTVTATPKPKDNDSGGSSTHVGSSGTTHGGGSKSF